MTEMMDLYGIGDHGGGPTRAILDEGVSLDAARQGCAEDAVRHRAELLHAALRRRSRPNSPVWDYDSIAKGYTISQRRRQGKISHSDLEDEMYLRVSPRRVDHAGQPQAQYARQRRGGAERGEVCFAGVARRQRVSGQIELTEAWKKITFNDFHDLAAGSGIGIIYKEAQKDYDEVRWATNEISRRR